MGLWQSLCLAQQQLLLHALLVLRKSHACLHLLHVVHARLLLGVMLLCQPHHVLQGRGITPRASRVTAATKQNGTSLALHGGPTPMCAVLARSTWLCGTPTAPTMQIGVHVTSFLAVCEVLGRRRPTAGC